MWIQLYDQFRWCSLWQCWTRLYAKRCISYLIYPHWYRLNRVDKKNRRIPSITQFNSKYGLWNHCMIHYSISALRLPSWSDCASVTGFLHFPECPMLASRKHNTFSCYNLMNRQIRMLIGPLWTEEWGLLQSYTRTQNAEYLEGAWQLSIFCTTSAKQSSTKTSLLFHSE